MIIVEGPDGSGKTTLIEQLVEHTGLPVAPRVVSKDTEAMVDLKKWTEDNVWGGWQPTIFDRHRLISEPIYGPIFRDKDEPGFENLYWFSHMLGEFYRTGPVLIFCLPPLTEVMANVISDPDNRVIAPRTREVWGAYRNLAVTLFSVRLPGNTKLIHYDYTEDEQGVEVERIIHTVNRTIKERS